MSSPVLHVIAGPNGAGKSTLYRRVLGPATGLPFVNADEIAAARWDTLTPARSYEAAKAAAEFRDGHLAERRSFVTETVYSHESKVAFVQAAVDAGYLATLHVVMVPVELAVARVPDRVRNGGHAVPEDKIRGRYQRLWSHVAATVPVVAEAVVYDNSRSATPLRVVARFERGTLVGAADWPPWAPGELTALP